MKKAVLHDVHVNPPSNATGRVGAVGHINLTCKIVELY